MAYSPGNGAIRPDSGSAPRYFQQNQGAPQGSELTQIYEVSSYQVLSPSYNSVQVVEGDIKVSGS